MAADADLDQIFTNLAAVEAAELVAYDASFVAHPKVPERVDNVPCTIHFPVSGNFDFPTLSQQSSNAHLDIDRMVATMLLVGERSPNLLSKLMTEAAKWETRVPKAYAKHQALKYPLNVASWVKWAKVRRYEMSAIPIGKVSYFGLLYYVQIVNTQLIPASLV